MAFIDANYVLRYLLKDNPKQFLIVKEVIENQDISLTDFIFAEAVYVLEKVYSVPRNDIKDALGGLMEYKNLVMENKNVILKSLQIYSESKIDFADALLIAYHKESSNIVLHTFDKKILKIISAL
jgi:predicted nucleic-acid-binding protein